MDAFEIQLTCSCNDTLPVTRGYMEKCEKVLADYEIAHQPSQRAVEEPKRSRRKVGERK